MLRLLRRVSRPTARWPLRGVEEFWRGGYHDPATPGETKHDNAITGDPWPAALLRLKSFEDLQKLWYVCLKEKNFLMAERESFRRAKMPWKHHGRMKKVKLSMKRILTVLSRREIHQQCIRAKEMLEKQQERETLEVRRFHLEERALNLRAKASRLAGTDSLMQHAYQATALKCREDLAKVELDLRPLRKDTMQLLAADWRYQRKYSDLPGIITWKRQWIRGLQERAKNPMRSY